MEKDITITPNLAELELQFELATDSKKKLEASVGKVNDLKWTGKAQSVTFNVDEGSGNMQIKEVKVKTSTTTGIETIEKNGQTQDAVWTLLGQRVTAQPLKAGIYVKNGRKFIVR